ncbi:MAG: tetratricopeptide repeat protein, partial [Burkholderiaceae bacterium]|nr:tetratricopeptide repeat protein [Burkholderiaceae bacterium]
MLLAACSSAPVVPPIDSAAREQQALGAIESGDLLAARSIYQELVQRTIGDERSRFQIALAQTDIELGDPEGALALLAAINPPLSPALESALTAARASALFALGQTVEAVRLLIEREIWLESSGEILDNQARI